MSAKDLVVHQLVNDAIVSQVGDQLPKTLVLFTRILVQRMAEMDMPKDQKRDTVQEVARHFLSSAKRLDLMDIVTGLIHTDINVAKAAANKKSQILLNPKKNSVRKVSTVPILPNDIQALYTQCKKWAAGTSVSAVSITLFIMRTMTVARSMFQDKEGTQISDAVVQVCKRLINEDIVFASDQDRTDMLALMDLYGYDMIKNFVHIAKNPRQFILDVRACFAGCCPR